MKKKRYLSIITALLLCLNVLLPTYASNIPDTTAAESNYADSEQDSSSAPESESILSESEESKASIPNGEDETSETTENSIMESETISSESSESESETAESELSESIPPEEDTISTDEPSLSTPFNTFGSNNSISASSTSIDSVRNEASTIFQAARAALPTTYSRTSSAELEMQIEMVIYINLLRQEYGLEPVALYPQLCDAAMIRAEECQTTFNENHTRPDGRECFSILDDMGLPWGYAGENIARGYWNVLDVMTAWWNSEGHRGNILDSDFQTVGVGMNFSSNAPTWTQIFTGGYTIASADLYNLKDTYYVGDSLQEQGIYVLISYSNGVEGFVPILDTMISGYNPNKEGVQNITVSCQGMTGTFQINVIDPVKAFVSRLYTQILGRQADPAGLSQWANVLRSGKEQGAKVAQGFIDSTEFKKRNLSDTEYVTTLYRTFFNREPDEGGLKAWLKVLDSGLSRLHVFKGFAESDEFTKLCSAYGIERGFANLTAPMDQNEGVTKFIARCYKLCLGRKADESGLNGWCSQILTGANTAKQAAHGFVFSEEFKKKNLSDTEFVKTMYRVFMDREADGAGLNAWVKVLQSGQSREHVFNGFADSNEFREICASYGIK